MWFSDGCILLEEAGNPDLAAMDMNEGGHLSEPDSQIYSLEAIPEGPTPQFDSDKMNSSGNSESGGMSEGSLMGLDAEDE